MRSKIETASIRLILVIFIPWVFGMLALTFNSPFIPWSGPSLIWIEIWIVGFIHLFLGGLAAGILFFAALFYLLGKDKEYPVAVKVASIIPPIALSVGLLALVYDLTHKLYTWQLYMTVRIESPMSWGAWVLMFITPLSMLWVFSYYSELFPKWNLKRSTPVAFSKSRSLTRHQVNLGEPSGFEGMTQECDTLTSAL